MRIGSDGKRSTGIGAVGLGYLHQLIAHGGEHDLFALVASDIAAGNAHAPDRDFFPAVWSPQKPAFFEIPHLLISAAHIVLPVI